MKKIFKRKKKPLIIAPTHFHNYVSQYIIPTASASDTVIIYEPKTVSAIEKILEHQAGISKSIKIVGATENFAGISDALRNKGYSIEVEGG